MCGGSASKQLKCDNNNTCNTTLLTIGNRTYVCGGNATSNTCIIQTTSMCPLL